MIQPTFVETSKLKVVSLASSRLIEIVILHLRWHSRGFTVSIMINNEKRFCCMKTYSKVS